MSSVSSGSPSWNAFAACSIPAWNAIRLSPKAGSPMSCLRPIPRRMAHRDQEMFLVSFLWRVSYRTSLEIGLQWENDPPPKSKSQGETSTMKKLSVVVAGSGQIRDIEIQPGTTAGDVLHQ